MSSVIDLKGCKFGELVVIERFGSFKGRATWLCRCSCGNKKVAVGQSLRRGRVKSCGCVQRQQMKLNGKTLDANKKYNPFYEYTNIALIKRDKKIQSNNTSGVTGVYWIKDKAKWRAEIKLKQKSIYLGYFQTKEDAIKARKEAEEKYFKPIIEEYENGGKINE